MVGNGYRVMGQETTVLPLFYHGKNQEELGKNHRKNQKNQGN